MLYGDGIHDDTLGIQELLDTGAALVELPMPEKAYLVSKTLVIHSNQELRLPRLATIRLADHSNCLMLTNENYETGDKNIHITGGIWDLNNMGQIQNPLHFPHPEYPDYWGLGLLLQNVRNMYISNLTLKDPASFALTLDSVSYFTVENVDFDFNHGNPWAVNMDGVHLNGNCHFGTLRNLKGACYDDLVALNADEGTRGPITDIDVDGIYAEGCHSAVRLLSVNCRIERVHIHNVFGTYFQYCIGVTKYQPQETSAYYDALSFDHIFASKAERLPIYHKDGTFVYPVIWIEKNLRIKNLAISNVYRTETVTSIPTLSLERNSVVEHMSLSNISCENQTGIPMPLFENEGTIHRLFVSNLRANGDRVFAGNGVWPEGFDVNAYTD